MGLGRRHPAPCQRGTATIAYLDKGVDGEDDEFGLCFGIVHEVEVDELLLLEVVGLLSGGELDERRAASSRV